MKFNEKLLYLRATLKMSQSQLAKELGVGIATINRWETEKNKPTKRAECAFDMYCKKNKIEF